MLLFFHEIYQNLMRLELEQLRLSVWNSSFKKQPQKWNRSGALMTHFFYVAFLDLEHVSLDFCSHLVFDLFLGPVIFFFFLSQDLFIYLFLLFLCSLLLFGYLGLKAKTKLVQIHFFLSSKIMTNRQRKAVALQFSL